MGIILSGSFLKSLDGVALSKRTTSIGAKPLWRSKTLFLIAFFRRPGSPQESCHPAKAGPASTPDDPQGVLLIKVPLILEVIYETEHLVNGDR